MENSEGKSYEIRQLMDHPRFPQILVNVITEARSGQLDNLDKAREESKRDLRLRRNWWNQLEDAGYIMGKEISVLKLAHEYILILNKKCKLASNLRVVIQELFNTAFQLTIKAIEAEEKKLAMRAKKEAQAIKKANVIITDETEKPKRKSNKAKLKEDGKKEN